MKQPAEIEDGIIHQGGQLWSPHISEYEGTCGERMETKTEHIKRIPVRSQVTTLHAALILCHTCI